jgi:metal-responsive CopG/Arc/MetJ family transcriptional regulator
MKTAVSLPDDLFAEVERLAQRTGRGRSEVYAAALREYVLRHDPDQITKAINAVVAEVEESPGERQFRMAAARRVLERTEW